MSDSNSGKKTTISVPVLVFIVFLTLKLAEIGVVATWSWWWVTAPLWGGLAIVLVVCMMAILVAGVFGGLAVLINWLQGK